MEIRRDRYLERLIAHKGNGRVKVVAEIVAEGQVIGISKLIPQNFQFH